MEVRRRDSLGIRSVVILTTVFAMMTVCFFVLMFCARTIVLSKQLLQQKIEFRAAQSLETAGQTMAVLLNELAVKTADQEYRNLIDELDRGDLASMTEQETLILYQTRYADAIRAACEPQALDRELHQRFAVEKGSLVLDPDQKAVLETQTDAQGRMEACILRNVRFSYSYGQTDVQDKEFTYEFEVPSATFYNGNDLLFDYSMIAEKGIYITGKTSSIVGNVFAGTHPVEEYRKAESSYGERRIYGGINVLSTQLGIEADHVISTGDINLKGAFVAFGTEEKDIQVYAGELNAINNYFMRTNYTVNGRMNPRQGELYERASRMVVAAGKPMKDLNYYYDSDNDETYQGKYRKLFSNTDVTVSGDFTGAILTSGNIIIEANSNVEGFLYSKDRIYIQGNNNIVSNRDIMREMVNEECAGEKDLGEFRLMDYLGGMSIRGYAPQSDVMVQIDASK